MGRHRLVFAAIATAVLLAPTLGHDVGGPPASAAPPAGRWVPIGPNRVHAPAVQPGDGTQLGTYDAVGRITALAVHPTDDHIIYAASAGQLGHEGSGVWKTTDGGGSWIPVTDEQLPTPSIGALAVDPSDPDVVYAITADEGLWRSDDAGASWLQLHGDLHIRSNTDTGDWVVLLIDPTDADVMWLTSDDGVLRSDDGGSSWATSLSAAPATSLVMDPADPDVLYAALLGHGVYSTVDGGDHWVAQGTGTGLPSPAATDRRGVLLALSHPSSTIDATVYALFPRPTGTVFDWDLYRTTDGIAWTQRTSPCVNAASSCFVTVLAADPAEPERLYVGGGPLWVSGDGGQSFTVVPAAWNDRQPASPHGDYWEFVTDPQHHAVTFAGTDGGLYRSSQHGAEGSWTFIGQGISNAEMYDIALASTPNAMAISGTQDNGNIRYTGGLVWDHLPVTGLTDRNGNPSPGAVIWGGDGAAVAVDPGDANRSYAVFDNRGTPAVSTDGGSTFTEVAAGLTGNDQCGIWNMTFHLQIHPNDPTLLIESCSQLWRLSTAGPITNWTWSKIFTAPGQAVNRSAVQPDLDVYYAGTTQGRIFAAVGGTGWSSIPVFADPESKYVSDLEVDPNHPDRLYVSFAPVTTVDRSCRTTAGVHRVYRLVRTGAGPAGVVVDATDITGDLTGGLCVNALAIDPVVENTVYAATNRGIYRGRPSGTAGTWSWQPYNDGLPPADVRDLEVHPVTGHIFAATFGRGAYEVAPETNSPPELVVPGPQTVDYHDALGFTVSATDVDAGDTLSFDASGLPAGLVLVDHGNGTATVSGVVTAVPAMYHVTISVSDGTNPPVSALVRIEVTKEQTTTAYTGPLVVAAGLPTVLTGRLLEDGSVPVAGRVLTLRIGAQSCTGTTDADGTASCTVPSVSAPLGEATVGAAFAGDAYYLPSSASDTAIVFSFPERGIFVLGEPAVTAAGTTNPVTFWGAQWRKSNGFATGSEAAFLGFASTVPTDPACGDLWSTEPGASSEPVESLPTLMGVAVTSSVSSSGSTISGDVVEIVVVETSPTYEPDAGHAGTGIVVATFCSSP